MLNFHRGKNAATVQSRKKGGIMWGSDKTWGGLCSNEKNAECSIGGGRTRRKNELDADDVKNIGFWFGRGEKTKGFQKLED